MVDGGPGRRRRPTLLGVGGYVLVAFVLILLWIFRPSGEEGPPPPRPAPAPAAPAAGKRAVPVPPAAAPAQGGAALPEGPAGDPAQSGPRWVVTGVVLDPEEHPAAGVLVWVDEGRDGRTLTCLTTGAGRYEFAVVPGAHGLHARGEGTGTAAVFVPEAPAGERVEAPALCLPAGSVIRGRVVDGAGKPRPRVRVRCWSEDDAADPLGESMMDGHRFILGGDDVITDQDGRFVLRGLAGGDATYRVYPDLHMVYYLSSDPPQRKGVKADGESLEFKVAGSGVLRGVVVDSATGEAIPFFSVAERGFDGADGRFEVELGEDREVRVAARGYAEVWIPARDPGGEGGDRRVALEPAEDSGVLVLLVSGEGGESVAGLRAEGVLGSAMVWKRTWPGADREFRVGRVLSGDHTVYLWAEGWSAATVPVAVPKGREVRAEVMLRRCGSARVRLLDAKGVVLRYPHDVRLRDAEGDGPPVRWVYSRPQGTSLVVTELQQQGDKWGTWLNLSECDGRLVGVLPGTYRLSVRDGGVSKEAAFAVAAGEEVEVTVRLGE